MGEPILSIQDCIARLLGNSKTASARVTTLPYDVVRHIFDVGDMCTSVCLALTCTKLYAFLKIRYPEPIPLFQTTCNNCAICKIGIQPEHLKDIILSCLLVKWAGPRYRVVNLTAWSMNRRQNVQYFRCVQVFGKGILYSKAENRLQQMYKDYETVAEKQPGEKYAGEIADQLLLLWPYNQGEKEWDKAAIAAILGCMGLFKNIERWHEYFVNLDLAV